MKITRKLGKGAAGVVALAALTIVGASWANRGGNVEAIGLDAGGANRLNDVDMSRISKAALVKAPEVVECELENGASAKCVKFVVKYQPDDLQTGPFAPQTMKDVGGIWDWDGDKAGLYRIDEKFLTMLKGQGYTFYDADGKVHVTDVRTSRPAYKNSLLAASLDTSVEMTILLPQTPVKAAKPTSLGTVAKVGLALDGVPIFADAPSVLQTGHMPALDPCGGHVDPGGWYHWHATATDINTVFKHENVDADCGVGQQPSALFAYAFDGYPIYGSVDKDGAKPTDLDACGGHTSATLENPDGSYHYHASDTFPNLPGCLSGVSAKNNFSTTAKQGIGAKRGQSGPGGPGGPGGPPPGRGGSGGPPGRGGPGGPPPGFDIAAKKLGVSVDELGRAVMENGGRQLDFAAAAKDLGVSEAALKAALPPAP